MISNYLGRREMMRIMRLRRLNSCYHERLRDDLKSDKIWEELRNLGLWISGLNNPSIFTTEELNSHFSSISSDPFALSESEFLEGFANENYFPHFSFSKVTLSDVKLAMKQSFSQGRGYDGVPQSVICAAFPGIGEFILDIFNKSMRELVFPSIWKKSLVPAMNKIAIPRSLSDFRPIAMLLIENSWEANS